MSIGTVIAGLEAKLKHVEEQISSHTTGLATITADIEKFLAGKTNLLNNMNILNGAKQAFEAALSDAKALTGDVATGNVIGLIEDTAKTATDVAADVSAVKSEVNGASS